MTYAHGVHSTGDSPPCILLRTDYTTPSTRIYGHTFIKKVTVLSVIALTIIAVFLSVSRAPALDQKARMGLRTDISSIAFETVLDVSDTDPWLERVLKSAVNWTWTNWKGMTFGILFGATLLSVVRALPFRTYSRNGFIAAMQGMFGGAPLGVCVNCATPIAQGLQRAGVRLESMLALLMASPTLNLIVITMMLSLFSGYFVLIKLITTVLFIVVVIPAIVWFWTRFERIDGDEISLTPTGLSLPATDIPDTPGWRAAFRSSLTDLLRNLVFLLRITLPLMLLAGLLGAVLVESFSLESLAGLPVNFWSYLSIALIGTLLPVPIAFDVVLTSALVSVGLPAGLAMTLFFSLSIFSIFPFMVIGRDVSWKLGLLLCSTVILAAVTAGYWTTVIHERTAKVEASEIRKGLDELSRPDDDTPSRDLPPDTPAIVPPLDELVNTAGRRCVAVFGSELPCLPELLKRKAFGALDAALCERLKEIRPALQTGCEQQVHSSHLARLAIARNEIGICEDFDCRMKYLNANSHLPEALDLCETQIAKNLVELCRKVVLHHRITYFRSLDACTDDLTLSEREYCRSEVSARVAMEQMDIERCESLTDPASRTSCLFAVSAARVIDDGENFNCSRLDTASVVEACRMMQRRQSAITSGSIETCNGLPSRQQTDCQLEVIKNDLLSRQGIALRNLRIMASGSAPPVRVEPFTPPPAIRFEPLATDEGVDISVLEANPGRTETGRYSLLESDDTGLVHSWKIDATDLFEPFIYGKGISSGDINADGYPDLAIAFERGVYVYLNAGNRRFVLSDVIMPPAPFNAFLAALVDIDNDGWLDLFTTSYSGKQLFYLNRGGRFTGPAIEIPGNGVSMTMAAGFADIDQDGDLDMVLGKWAHGIERHFRSSGAENELWLNGGGALEKKSLFDRDPPGATLTVLLSDINADSLADIIIGNDRQTPDIFYFSTGTLSYAPPGPGIIPETSLNTMSYDSADYNNDLKLDLFSSDMTFTESGREDYCNGVSSTLRHRCERLVTINHHVRSHDIAWCNALDVREKKECLTASILQIAIRDNDPSLCTKITDDYPAKRRYCERTTGTVPPDPDIDLGRYPPQLTTNKFLMAWGQRFIDVTRDIGVSRSDWSWNARAVDVDNDRYQDILVGTGYGFGAPDDNDFTIDLQVFSNVLFLNQQGRRFVRAEDRLGLQDYVNTSAYTLTDIDLDGDIDVVSVGQLGGIRLFENRVNDRNRIVFELRDQRGNRFCIGCKIIIESASGKQLREIKASGGFLSFDEPAAFFGLDKDPEVNRVEIHWSTGESTIMNRTFPANHRYQLRRMPVGADHGK